jgi:hypothetical protein
MGQVVLSRYRLMLSVSEKWMEDGYDEVTCRVAPTRLLSPFSAPRASLERAVKVFTLMITIKTIHQSERKDKANEVVTVIIAIPMLNRHSDSE